MSSGSTIQVNAAGRRRSPATIPGYLAGRAPRNKGMEYPPDPPRPEEIVLVMRQAGQDRHGLRVRALVAVLWRGGLRISEALALNETDIDERRGSLLIRHGKGDKRRAAGMDQFGFEQLAAWLTHRVLLPPGPLLCVIDGATRGRRWSATQREPSCASSPSTLACGADSLRISCGTRTPSSSRAKGSLSTSSSASSGIPTWGPPARIFRGSIPARSSTPSAHAASRRSPPPPG
jgi:Phage integrase family